MCQPGQRVLTHTATPCQALRTPGWVQAHRECRRTHQAWRVQSPRKCRRALLTPGTPSRLLGSQRPLLLPSPPARTCLRHRHLPHLPLGCSQPSDQQQLHLCLTNTEGSTGQRSAAFPLVPTATSTVTSIHVSTPNMASVSTPDQ